MHSRTGYNFIVMPRGMEKEARQHSHCHSSQYDAQGHPVSWRMDSGRDGSWKPTALHLYSSRGIIKMTQQAHNSPKVMTLPSF